MLLSTFLPTFALISSLFLNVAEAKPQAFNRKVSRTTITPIALNERSSLNTAHISDFEKRAVLQANVCATIGTSVQVDTRGLGGIVGGVANVAIAANPNICLCLVNGVLNPTSAADIRQYISTNIGLSVLLATLGVDLPTLGNLAVAATETLLGSSTAPTGGPCNFPVGAIPLECGTCKNKCPDGQVNCNGTCRTLATCPSGSPIIADQLRRRHRGLSAHLLCPASFSACAISGRGSEKFECLDTQSSVDTCGGCEFPLDGESKGVDCTALSNVSGVSCVRGRCIVQSCEKGFTLVGEECLLV